MNKRKFGRTEMRVSEVGFGAWGIGGPAMAGEIPIGWGSVDDKISIKAIERSLERGINFFDTADFYGFGHSENLLGKVIGSNANVFIATKVGHRLDKKKNIILDYTKKYILSACHKSLRRLNRDYIDLYQLHSAKLNHLRQSDCIEALEQLKSEGKIRYWGLSLNTFNPEPEANYLIDNDIGDSFQLVFNIINQRALKTIEKAYARGYGIIARMPLQFGLLTGKFNKNSKFPPNDHRYFRLTPEILTLALDKLDELWIIGNEKNINKTSLSLSFILSHKEISTVIPGIKSSAQADSNTTGLIQLSPKEIGYIHEKYDTDLSQIVQLMEEQG